MKNIGAIIITLSLLIFSAGCTNAQNNMRIALKQGYDNNSPVRIGDVTIELVNLFIRPEPWDGRNLSLQLEMKIMNETEKYTTFLGYYEKTNDQLRNNFPKASGKYLFDLDVREDEVDLLIRTLKFGDEFIIDQKEGRSVVVENLTITYNFGGSRNLIEPDHSYGGYEIVHLFKVSDGKPEEDLSFEYIDNKGAISSMAIREWKGYRIEILDDFREPLKLRVTKNGSESPNVD